MDYSIIIPCFNSENTLSAVIDEIRENTKKGDKCKIILVNDCSGDNTWDVITKLCQKHANILGINLSKNFGQHAARMAGLKYAEGEYIVFMDDDGQHPASGIAALLEKAEEGYDIVYSRFAKKKETAFRRFGSWVNEKMAVNIIGKPSEVVQSSFFLIRGYVGRELLNYASPFVYIFGGLMQITKNIANADVAQRDRMAGSSGYSFKKLIALWKNGFFGFSLNPIKLFWSLGTAFSVISVVSFIVAVIIPPTHYTKSIFWLLFALFFLCAVLMFALGFIGEYLARILISMNKMPQYVIKEVVEDRKE